MIMRPHMQQVRAKNTSAELVLRKLIWSMGFRGYRIHYSKLPGKPDVVFTKQKRAIFMHGCFWHGHSCRAGQNTPRSNLEYWNNKLKRNKDRDQINIQQLEEAGFRVLVIWECELKDKSLLESRLEKFLCVLST